MPDTVPRTPEALLEELFTIFPQYRTAYRGPVHDDTPTFHSVLMAFTPFFGAALASFSDAQLLCFARLSTAAEQSGGKLQNACGTCLLEHLHQIRADHVFRPCLNRARRELSDA